ncbi:MAG: 50S ribosomal protein L25 [Candidatus Parcubacteria bacterium]|nr:50S ribosomal protein L25 [Candidatus Parcubacteria bacterium]
MNEFNLVAQKRTVFGKKNIELRKTGNLPAVIYGPDFKSLALTINTKDFTLIRKQAGENSIINLEILEGDKKTKHNVLIHDVTVDPRSSALVHVDFYQVNMDKPVKAYIPLVFINESQAVKDGGILVKALDELEIEALPKDLPHEIQIDISSLVAFDQTIYVKDIVVPKGIKVLSELDNPVLSVSAPRTDEELKSLEEKVEEKVDEVKVEGELKRQAKAEEVALPEEK